MILIDILILVWVCYSLPEIMNNIKKCDPYYNIIIIYKMVIFVNIILILLCTRSIIQSLDKFIQWI